MNSENIQILISLLKLRKEDLKSRSDRMLKTVSLSVSIYTFIFAWAFNSNSQLSFIKTVYFTFIITFFWIFALILIKHHNKAFISSKKIMIRIEQALNLYEKNLYHHDGDSLYPDSWQNLTKRRIYSQINYFVIFSGAITVILLWLNYVLKIL
jgi:glucan phosphoethanolaminetransferase (alkaline phosphatase superfamily)